jgi:hypothetical protein
MVRGLHALLTWLNTPERQPPYWIGSISLAEAIDFADEVASLYLGGRLRAGLVELAQDQASVDAVRGYAALLYTIIRARLEWQRQGGLAKNLIAVAPRTSLDRMLKALPETVGDFLDSSAGDIIDLLTHHVRRHRPRLAEGLRGKPSRTSAGREGRWDDELLDLLVIEHDLTNGEVILAALKKEPPRAVAHREVLGMRENYTYLIVRWARSGHGPFEVRTFVASTRVSWDGFEARLEGSLPVCSGRSSVSTAETRVGLIGTVMGRRR